MNNPPPPATCTMEPLPASAAEYNPLAAMMNALGGPAAYTQLATQTASATPSKIIDAHAQPNVPAAEIKALFEQGNDVKAIAAALSLPPETVLAVGVSTGQIDPLELTNNEFKRFIITGLVKQAINTSDGAAVQLKALQQLKDLTLVDEATRYKHERINDDLTSRIVIVTSEIEKARQKSLAVNDETGGNKRITF